MLIRFNQFVFAKRYRPSDDGKYRPDGSGKYSGNDGRYVHQDNKYVHTADKFGAGGGTGDKVIEIGGKRPPFIITFGEPTKATTEAPPPPPPAPAVAVEGRSLVSSVSFDSQNSETGGWKTIRHEQEETADSYRYL